MSIRVNLSRQLANDISNLVRRGQVVDVNATCLPAISTRAIVKSQTASR
jgi:hypothetical protein